MTGAIICNGCGGQFPETNGPTHAYLESTPGCWACYGEVLAREYSDPRYRSAHRLTVDTYAVQHPGQPSPQSIRSVALHLISLCAIFENGADLSAADKIIQQAAKNKDRFEWLPPPPSRGTLTIADVHLARDAQAHVQSVHEWASSAWTAWAAHHPRIRKWLSQSWAV